MKRIVNIAAVCAALVLLGWSVWFLIHGRHLNQRGANMARDAYYDYDPRLYPYRVSCPVSFNFEARCNPEAIVDRRYDIDGPKRRVPAQCAERVVHGFFRNLPTGALAALAELDSAERQPRCRSMIDSGDSPAYVDVSGYVFRGAAVLVVQFLGKHLSVPDDYDAFDWLGEESLEVGEETQDALRVRVDLESGGELECLYVPFDMFFGGLPPELKASFICAEQLELTRAFVNDPPMRLPGPPED
ncbi:hypothetical protein FIV42_24555 [Persicimonas caeni]|uniref:Uncharacterized protein n=1 Tax=Persicimonas caeni TaxID=2292766 RepID=A0A4Y6PZN8_PERCE|nr:hypothetical protein [Persicimonas caeni]QDG53798.1 hypothetical protein FIV42_24555 [Persicimonas caeni]QED35019.1 hypothetical protein FRD00_24550 [Persicimonas caeni]